MALPPRHQVDHLPTYILSFDTAWRVDLIEASQAEHVEQGLAPEGHAIARYRSGEARCDTSTVESFIDRDLDPAIFTLRRLTHAQWLLAQSRAARGEITALSLCLRLSLVSVEGLDLDLAREPATDALSDNTMAQLRDLVGDAGWYELAQQAMALSQAPTEIEKKP
jgi:hypothetical protein